MEHHNRLVSLQSKKRELDNQIHDELVHPAQNVYRITELKKRRLMVREEIERLAKAT